MNSAEIMPPDPPLPGFKESIARCLRKYATFRGRATRAEYWWFSLFGTLLGLVVYAVLQHLQGTKAADESMGFVLLALFLPMLAVGVRRLHDIDFRGWWMLLGLTGVGIIPLCIFFCLPGKAADNRFGSREYDSRPKMRAEKRKPRFMGILLCLLYLAGLCLADSLYLAEIASGAESSASLAPASGESQVTPGSSPKAPASSGQGVEPGLQEVFGDIFSTLGEAIGGMTKGMQEGARDIQAQLDGSDGTRLITSGKDLAALTETRVLKAEQLEDRSWRIILAVKNPQGFPVRLTGLTDKRQVILLDQDDFVHEPSPVVDRVVTVPERAAQKLTFLFPELDGSTPRTLRLYGIDFAVPQATAGNVSP